MRCLCFRARVWHVAVVTSQLLVSSDSCITNDVSDDAGRPVPESVIGVDGTICSMLLLWVPENQEHSCRCTVQ